MSISDLENGDKIEQYEIVLVATESNKQDGFFKKQTKNGILGFFQKIAIIMKAEIRGIERIPEEEKVDTSFWNIATMWLSANMVIATFSIGSLSVGIWDLNFYVAVLTTIFFTLLGISSVAFFSIFGAKSGLRQMILTRFFMGWYGMKIFSLLNCIACIGWTTVNTIVAAQLLNIIGNGCPPWLGCLVISILTLFVAIFGYKIIHYYEQWSWLPNFIVFLIIAVRMGKSHNFDAGEWTSGANTAANVLSYGGAVYGFSTGWTSYASDYTVYMKKDTSSYKIFLSIILGLGTPCITITILGAACATGIRRDASWEELYNKKSVGGLVYAILVENSLGGFGQFCMVLLSLSTVSNNIPNLYSLGLAAQAFWSPFSKIPRAIWSLFGCAISAVLSIVGYWHFNSVLENLMNVIGYWLAIYTSTSLSEHFIWRRSFKGYNFDDYQDPKKIHIGISGVIGFCCGVVGAVMGMSQTWYTGLIGRKIGNQIGGDIGFELAASFAFLGYNISRFFEVKISR